MSRPAVSDDNPYSESLFKTLKYRPSYPDRAFSGIDEARQWVSRFVQWYNTEHLHSAIRFVTPGSRHLGKDPAILARRAAVYDKAKRLNPRRWSGPTRNWTPITEVLLNPKKHKNEIQEEFTVEMTTPMPRSKVSAVSEAVEPISDIRTGHRENGLHRCPITNASDSGEGLPWGKNPLSDALLRSSLRRTKLHSTMNSEGPTSENLC